MSELEPRADEPAGRSVVFSALRRSWIWIVGAAIVVGVVAWEVSLFTPERYEAESTVVLRSTQPFSALGDQQGGGDPERFLANQVAVATSTDVLTAAAAAEGVGATEEQLAEAVTVAPSTASDAFTVTATGTTGAEAAARANAVVAAYRAEITAQVTDAATTATTNNAAATQAAAQAAGAGAPAGDPDAAAAVRNANSEGALQAGQIAIRQAAYGDNVSSVDAAVAPTSPTEPKPARNGFIGAVLAALIASAVAIWRRGRSREDVEGLVRGSGVPLLGVVPVTGRRDQQVAEALAPLVSLRYLAAGRPKGPVLVTGLQSGDATAEVSLALAAAAARDGRSVLVLAPADDEAGLVHASGLPVAPAPLTARAAGGSLPPGTLAPVPALSHLPGRASLGVLDAPLLHGDSLGEVLDGLSAQHDLVVVAAGPLARSPRAFAVLGAAATSVAVVRSDRPAAQLSASWDELQDRLSVAGRTLDGVVVTQKGRKSRAPRSSGGSTAAGPSGDGGPAPAAVRPAPAALSQGSGASGGSTGSGPAKGAQGAPPPQKANSSEGLAAAEPRTS
jgi:capsular polysaccharide biosynthesis protein